MNYTLSCIDRSKRWLQVEWRWKTPCDNPIVYFNGKRSSFTSRLIRLQVHDKRNNELTIRRLNSVEWQINVPKGVDICVTYILHTFVMAPEETYVSGETWIINPKSCCLELENCPPNIPCSLTISEEESFYCAKPIRSDLEGKVVEFIDYVDMTHYTIMGGQDIRVYQCNDTIVYYKGELSSSQLNELSNITTPSENYFFFFVPRQTEKRALEYGINGKFTICPVDSTSSLQETIKSLVTVCSNIDSIEYKHECWFATQGWEEYQRIKPLRDMDQEEYRKMIERYYIRVFSMTHHPEETILDSSRAGILTRPRDVGVVLWHQLDMLFSRKNMILLEPYLDTCHHHQLIKQIEQNYGDSLEWLWSLCLYTRDLQGWLTVCQSYIKYDGFRLIQPKRGPLKVVKI